MGVWIEQVCGVPSSAVGFLCGRRCQPFLSPLSPLGSGLGFRTSQRSPQSAAIAWLATVPRAGWPGTDSRFCACPARRLSQSAAALPFLSFVFLGDVPPVIPLASHEGLGVLVPSWCSRKLPRCLRRTPKGRLVGEKKMTWGCEIIGEDGAGGVYLRENCYLLKVLSGLWMPSKRKNHGV